MTAPLLSVRGLCKHFPIHGRGFKKRVLRTVHAVDDVSFDLHPGETLGLVGESGSGKTTAARCILRAITPTAGRVLFRPPGGALIDLATLPEPALKPLRPHLQMVFQDPFSSLNPRMTVGQIVGEPLVVHGLAAGADLEARVADSLKRTGAFPLIDLAYLGFGDGIEKDAYGVRKVASSVPETMIAFSASKNFGLYRERTGVAIAIARDAATADVVSSQMQNVIRGTISQTPDHGAEIVRIILEDKELRAEWEAELNQMRERMQRLRVKLAEAIKRKSNSKDFDFIAEHSGMFSLLGLPQDVVEKLKKDDAVYMINDSRINVAGIPEDRVDELADFLIAAAG